MTDRDQIVSEAMKHPELIRMWHGLCQMRTCHFCRQKFPNGIVVRDPGGTNAKWFNGDYLFHCFTTHGYCPEVMLEFLHHTIAQFKRGATIEAE